MLKYLFVLQQGHQMRYVVDILLGYMVIGLVYEMVDRKCKRPMFAFSWPLTIWEKHIEKRHRKEQAQI